MGVGKREVEALVIDPSFWRGKRVLLTGHTGFKGSWASLVLASLGAEVHGLALPCTSANDLFVSANIQNAVTHRIGDIRDPVVVSDAVAACRPDIVLHMAAQALVRPSYEDPVGTFATNVMGTAHVLEAVRCQPGVAAVVVVTSDKCYENVGQIWGYRETDAMGGHDPYSSSKGCAELVTAAYRRSFFLTPGTANIASARAGNVIGGGDWSMDRLVPDAIRAFHRGEPVAIRNPHSVRPWQHVLDPVLGYLRLAERLASGSGFDEGWNFGPAASAEVPVGAIVGRLAARWGGGAAWRHEGGEHVHEASLLKLDCAKATARLGWHQILDLDDALELTVTWYRAFYDRAEMRDVTMGQIEAALARAASASEDQRNALLAAL